MGVTEAVGVILAVGVIDVVGVNEGVTEGVNEGVGDGIPPAAKICIILPILGYASAGYNPFSTCHLYYSCNTISC